MKVFGSQRTGITGYLPIGQAEGTQGLAGEVEVGVAAPQVAAEEHRGPDLPLRRRDHRGVGVLSAAVGDVDAIEERQVADHDGFAADDRGDALAVDCGDVGGVGDGLAVESGFDAGGDCPGDGVIAEALDRQRNAEQIFGAGRIGGFDVGENRAPFGERPGLVEGNGIDGAERLERPAALDQDAGASGAGKSSVMDCVAGAVRPDVGRGVLHGETLFDAVSEMSDKGVGALLVMVGDGANDAAALAAADVGVQAMWLSVLIGVPAAPLLYVGAGTISSWFGATGEVLEHAETYLSLSAIGVPFFLVTLAAQGVLRGASDYLTPLWVLVAANVANLLIDLEERGLLVPVIRDADHKDMVELAAEVADKAERARSRELNLDEIRGGSCTLTNIGPLGGVFATPIINQPELAIVGLHAIKERPEVVQGEIAIRKMMYLSVSFDHRYIDGAQGARFMSDFVKLVSDPKLLMVRL